MTLPTVSVVIVNWNGWHHLKTCLESVRELDYPRDLLEVIVVDNGSTDGSPEQLSAQFPGILMVRNRANEGFARANNQAAKLSRSDMLALLNNDVAVPPDWLRQMTATMLAAGPLTAAIASRIVSFDGKTLQFDGGGSNFHGIAYQRGFGESVSENYSRDTRRTLFACGAAMLVDRRVFNDTGGFDEDFFSYYEDVDFGWRLWVMGYQVLYAPEAVARHHHSATSRKVPLHQLRLLQVRNPWFTIFKNYGDDLLQPALLGGLLLSLQRTLLAAGLRDSAFHIAPHSKGEAPSPGNVLAFVSHITSRIRNLLPSLGEGWIPIRRLAAADLIAYQDLLEHFPEIVRKRHHVQQRRRRRDEEILPLFEDPMRPAEDLPSYVSLSRQVTHFLGLQQAFSAYSSEPAHRRAGSDTYCLDPH